MSSARCPSNRPIPQGSILHFSRPGAIHTKAIKCPPLSRWLPTAARLIPYKQRSREVMHRDAIAHSIVGRQAPFLVGSELSDELFSLFGSHNSAGIHPT